LWLFGQDAFAIYYKKETVTGNKSFLTVVWL